MKGRILLVEDDPAITMALQDRLKSEGYAAECVRDGTAGLEKSVGSVWDLIILDIMLPGKDGLEVCRDIRAKGVDSPILMLTARDTELDRVLGLERSSCSRRGMKPWKRSSG